MAENYLNHPTFGLLFRVCQAGDTEIFTTLYAGRYFFKVKLQDQDIIFDPISSNEVRELIEKRLVSLRQANRSDEHEALLSVFQKLFP